jgi:hypothetical protein
MEIIRRVEQLAARLVYIETPNGFVEQTAFDGNPFQRHLSGWFPHDFEARGYTVIGGGVRRWRGSGSKPPGLPSPIINFLNRTTQWYILRHPAHAAAIGAIRYIDENGDIREV